ncbi:MAG TPA: dockerin type I domain-containing protein [Planctomycetota bacterium]|nr:dockerin type I domain-containing protein [Planctomycetota bacterium]
MRSHGRALDGNNAVDVFDLIFVRNLLGQTAGTGDNWKADVNEDGRINVLT